MKDIINKEIRRNNINNSILYSEWGRYGYGKGDGNGNGGGLGVVYSGIRYGNGSSKIR